MGQNETQILKGDVMSPQLPQQHATAEQEDDAVKLVK